MKKLLLLFLILFLLTSCGAFPGATVSVTPTQISTPLPPTQTPIPFAISMGNLFISHDEYDGEIERYKASLAKLGLSKSDDEITKFVQDELVAQLLLANSAFEAGYTLTEEDLQKKIDGLIADLGSKEKLDAWIVANNYTDEIFRVALKRNSAAAWMRNEISTKTPKTAEQVHIRQLLLYDQATAQYYFDQLQSGIEFELLATQIEPVTRGDIGWFPRGYIPDPVVEEAAFGLEVGATSPIITGNVGFYILKCIEKQPEKELSPHALAVMQKQAISDWIETQKANSNILLQP